MIARHLSVTGLVAFATDASKPGPNQAELPPLHNTALELRGQK